LQVAMARTTSCTTPSASACRRAGATPFREGRTSGSPSRVFLCARQVCQMARQVGHEWVSRRTFVPA
jgi:hypothetical protein